MNNKKRIGGQTIIFSNPPSVKGFAAVVGQKEGEGPLGNSFDKIENDASFGAATWEKAESQLISETIDLCVKKTSVSYSDINYVIAGDLLNQCTATSFALKDKEIPFIGIYGACSTMAEGLSVAAMLVDGDFAENSLAVASSHFCSSEKQFRFPLEYGGQRTPTAQWTVTGCGAVCVGKNSTPPYITHITTGKIVDKGIKDTANMGAAMAPAFISTLKAHFDDTGRKPKDYDLILSGDLGCLGKKIAIELADAEGINITKNYNDCGTMIFDAKTQDTHSGGSGCGCSASVLCGHILPQIISGKLERVLFIATGALMSPTSSQQGQSIPGIAHAVVFDRNI